MVIIMSFLKNNEELLIIPTIETLKTYTIECPSTLVQLRALSFSIKGNTCVQKAQCTLSYLGYTRDNFNYGFNLMIFLILFRTDADYRVFLFLFI